MGKMIWFVSKWRAKAERLEHEIIALQMTIDALTEDVKYFRGREERAVAALLDIQNKPAITKPDTKGTMDFIDKAFDMFGDTAGGEEVV